jgi:hexosaminidase
MPVAKPAILPHPLSMKHEPSDQNWFVLTHDTVLIGTTELESVLQAYCDDLIGFRPMFRPAFDEMGSLSPAVSTPTVMQLSIQPDLQPAAQAERYHLAISPSRLDLTASTTEGLFRGLQTLRQLIHQGGNRTEARAVLPCLQIKDQPFYAYRGFMLDVGRHFFDVQEIKKLLDACALLKLNAFHWHLTEDQGWRIDIPAYPRLTEIGSRRRETRKDNKPVEGFYTQDQIRDVVRYASDRFITIIPEIDLPGHIRSALAAYPHLGCNGAPIEVATRFGIFPEILCAGKDTTLEFLTGVLDEICHLFPGPWIHLGGDEAPKQAWRACPHCRKRIREEGLSDEQALQGWLTNQMAAHVGKYGKKVVVWNDSLKAGNLSPEIAIQYWMEAKKPSRLLQAANEGRNWIASDFFHLYFDYPHGMTPLSKTFGYNPVPDEMTEEGARHLMGVEAALWTEQVTTREQLEKLIFPRLAAMAELGWHGPAEPSGSKLAYREFLSCLSGFLRLLTHLGLAFTPPDKADRKGLPGVFQTIRHFARVMDWETVKTLREMRKND